MKLCFGDFKNIKQRIVCSTELCVLGPFFSFHNWLPGMIWDRLLKKIWDASLAHVVEQVTMVSSVTPGLLLSVFHHFPL